MNSDRLKELDRRYARQLADGPRLAAEIQRQIRREAAAEEAKLTPEQLAIRERHRARIRRARLRFLDGRIDALVAYRDRVAAELGEVYL